MLALLGEIDKRGQQKPQRQVEPRPRVQSFTDDAAMLYEHYSGLKLDDWQLLVLDAWLSCDENDVPTYLTCCCSCPRQNGKNAILEAYELYKITICGEMILHTAHLVDTATKSFNRLLRLFQNPENPDFEEEITELRRSNGQWCIKIQNGGGIEFSSRSRGGSRGATYSAVVFDEAQEFTDEQAEAIVPTLAASPTGYRQLLYTGTPPSPSAPGTIFRNLRNTVLNGTSPDSLCWHEWGIEDLPAKDATFESLIDDVYATNPAMGTRLDIEFAEAEFATMSLDGFARERLGWWSAQGSSYAISEALWASTAVSKSKAPKEGKKAFGVKFSPDGALVSLCACRLPEEGSAFVECVGTASMADGIGWLSDFLANEDMEETTAAIAVDGKNGADALLDKLREYYPRQALLVPGSKGVIEASVLFEQALKEHTLTHWDGGKKKAQAALDNSAIKSIKRPIGHDGGWAYGGDDSAVIESAALAYWAAKTTNREPEGGCLIL